MALYLGSNNLSKVDTPPMDMVNGGGGSDKPVYLGTIPVNIETAYYAVAPLKDYRKVRIVKERLSYNSTLKTNWWLAILYVDGGGLQGGCRSIGAYHGTPGYKFLVDEIEYDGETIICTTQEINNENAAATVMCSTPRNDALAYCVNDNFNIETDYYAFYVVDPTLAFDGNETVHVWGWPR